MINSGDSLLIIATISAITILLRFLPFWIFSSNEKIPGFILYLGKVLPCAMIGMLIVYCLRDVSLLLAPYGIPELLAILIVVGTYLWKRNTLLSIGASLLFYMFVI
ncbi:MAG: AzlD domain-containing protein [Clostridiales bacterium]